MKVAEFLATVSNNMPSDVPDGSIINWINALEDDVYTKVVGSLNTVPFISEDGLTEATRYKPVTKTFELADTQGLSLMAFGVRWSMMYEYYVYAQIALLKEEFAKFNNYIALYNSLINEFYTFYNSRYKTDRDWR